MVDHRALMERIVAGMNVNDYSIYERCFTEDFVDEYPQSGELIRGRAEARWIFEHYPDAGGRRDIDTASLQTRAAVGYKVLAPSFSIVQVEGGGARGTLTIRGKYPDNSVWWVIILYELRDAMVCRTTTFFAPEFAPPAWRAEHVERMPGR